MKRNQWFIVAAVLGGISMSPTGLWSKEASPAKLAPATKETSGQVDGRQLLELLKDTNGRIAREKDPSRIEQLAKERRGLLERIGSLVEGNIISAGKEYEQAAKALRETLQVSRWQALRSGLETAIRLEPDPDRKAELEEELADLAADFAAKRMGAVKN